MDSVISFAEISKNHNSGFSPAHSFDVIPNVNQCRDSLVSIPKTRHAYWNQVIGLYEVYHLL